MIEKRILQKLKSEKIDLVYTSPFLRTQETTEIIVKELGLSKDQIITDKRQQRAEKNKK